MSLISSDLGPLRYGQLCLTGVYRIRVQHCFITKDTLKTFIEHVIQCQLAYKTEGQVRYLFKCTSTSDSVHAFHSLIIKLMSLMQRNKYI